jgi:hypothetical protein
MDDANTTTGTLEADEDILTYTISDEALEAAAGMEREGWTAVWRCTSGVFPVCPNGCIDSAGLFIQANSGPPAARPRRSQPIA